MFVRKINVWTLSLSVEEVPVITIYGFSHSIGKLLKESIVIFFTLIGFISRRTFLFLLEESVGCRVEVLAMATDTQDSKHSRVVAVAIDNSEYAEKAFDCKYFLFFLISFSLYLFTLISNILKISEINFLCCLTNERSIYGIYSEKIFELQYFYLGWNAKC